MERPSGARTSLRTSSGGIDSKPHAQWEWIHKDEEARLWVNVAGLAHRSDSFEPEDIGRKTMFAWEKGTVYLQYTKGLMASRPGAEQDRSSNPQSAVVVGVVPHYASDYKHPDRYPPKPEDPGMRGVDGWKLYLVIGTHKHDCKAAARIVKKSNSTGESDKLEYGRVNLPTEGRVENPRTTKVGDVFFPARLRSNLASTRLEEKEMAIDARIRAYVGDSLSGTHQPARQDGSMNIVGDSDSDSGAGHGRGLTHRSGEDSATDSASTSLLAPWISGSLVVGGQPSKRPRAEALDSSTSAQLSNSTAINTPLSSNGEYEFEDASLRIFLETMLSTWPDLRQSSRNEGGLNIDVLRTLTYKLLENGSGRLILLTNHSLVSMFCFNLSMTRKQLHGAEPEDLEGPVFQHVIKEFEHHWGQISDSDGTSHRGQMVVAIRGVLCDMLWARGHFTLEKLKAELEMLSNKRRSSF